MYISAGLILMRLTIPLVFILALSVGGMVSAQQVALPKLLVIDYAMRYPAQNAGVLSVFTEAGFEVHYRPYYPAMTERDRLTYDVIVLMGGGDPGMSIHETELAISFVARGKVLILATPPDSEYGGDRPVNPGAHDRYMFNRLMNRLNIKMYAVGKSSEAGAVLNPAVAFEPSPNHMIGQGLDGPIAVRAGTRILVGTDAEPWLVEPEVEERPVAVEPAEQKGSEVKMVRRRIRIQASEAIPDEEIELLLRGPQKLRAWLYYKNREQPAPADWTPAEFNGQVVRATRDTVTVRVSGNRWGSDYGLVGVPVSVVAVAFVKREMPEEIDSDDNQEALLSADDIGRPAVAAVGRSDRLQKGFVVAVGRHVLNALSRPVAPIGLSSPTDLDQRRLTEFLVRMGRYIRTTLLEQPDTWQPEHPFPAARIPGVQKPKYSVNETLLLGAVPERVNVLINKKRPADLMRASATPPLAEPLRGPWDYVFRQEDHIKTLVTALPDLGLNFLWTVAPVASYEADSLVSQSMPLASWGQPIADLLDGSSVAWYTGLSIPEQMQGKYRESLNSHGTPVGLPSWFDMSYLKRHWFDPTRMIARYSQDHSALKGIIHDWDTHINRDARGYSMTDAFEDEQFFYFVRYLARNGLYHGDDFNTMNKLAQDERFEWLMKSGHLEAYFQVLESNAEKLGRLYRQTIDEINPALHHGAFIRTLEPSWFHLGFWRGAGTPERPFIVMSYERPPAWFGAFLRDHGISARVVPVGLLGLMNEENTADVLRTAVGQGSYGLERGIWLFADPESEQDLSSPPDNLPRTLLLERIREANK
jgi:hypothetical protein